MDQSDVEDLPEWDCFSKALQWQIPWTDAAEQLRLSLPCTLAHFPSHSVPVHECLETLSTHVQRYSAAIHLELSQYFSFTDDPVLYLKNIQEYITLWHSPHSSQEKYWQGAANSFYMLNGEHFPWRERTVTQTEQDLEIQPAQYIPPTRKHQPKWLEELYTWLLAILSAALFLTVYVKTSSGWLAFLSFLIPSLFIILWNVIIGPKKTSAIDWRRTRLWGRTVLPLMQRSGLSISTGIHQLGGW
ncbi:hypothetical protein P4255_16370 [Bacillus wiedmannii]|uniref:hypothetical protein n=1 Tax=Bacillus wiedmannii TaxID=1890302 RepID=UPI002E213EEA|nr:hypothetical protein [Bacillus wiedmannii]